MAEGEPRPPEPLTEGPLAGTHRWWLRVVATTDVTPVVRRLRLTAPSLERLAPQPGQDLMFAVPITDADAVAPAAVGGPGTTNRRYTLRRWHLEGPEPWVDVDVVLHGSGPGARWAAAVRPGDVVEAVGPRGKVVAVEGAPAHLFVGDAAGAPAMLAMLESLPSDVPGTAVLVLEADDERQPTAAPSDRVVELVGQPPSAVDGALRAAVVPGVAAYLAGERADVQRWKAVLEAAGVPSDAIAAKAYWRRGTANAGHGEPAREG